MEVELEVRTAVVEVIDRRDDRAAGRTRGARGMELDLEIGRVVAFSCVMTHVGASVRWRRWSASDTRQIERSTRRHTARGPDSRLHVPRMVPRL